MYKRIISLSFAATELIYLLDLEGRLVGRSHEGDHTATVRQLPACTQAIQNDIIGASVDKQTEQLLRNALPGDRVDEVLIKALNPDLLITTYIPEGFKVSLPGSGETVKRLSAGLLDVILLKLDKLETIFDEITMVAARLGVPEAGVKLNEAMQDRVNLVRHKLKFIQDKPSVACITWLEPIMITGGWIPDLVKIAGGLPVLAESGKSPAAISAKELINLNPDIVILMHPGLGIEHTMRQLNLLTAIPGFKALQAVKNNRLYIADGNKYFNRPGPRMADSLEILAEIINPKQFIFGYEGDGWIKFGLV